jgi:hypothetical protein
MEGWRDGGKEARKERRREGLMNAYEWMDGRKGPKFLLK